MANVKISALSTLPGNEVSGNDLFLVSTSNLQSRSLSVSNARIAISDANDFITYSILNSNLNSYAAYANATFATNATIETRIAALVDSSPASLDTLRELANALGNDASFSTTIVNSIGDVRSNVTLLQGSVLYSNSAISNLQVGLAGANSAISVRDTIANVYATWNYLNANIVALQGGIAGANSSIAAKDSVANVYATYLALSANDGVTLTAAYANDYSTYTTLTGAYSANDGVTLTAAYANDYSTYTTLTGAYSANDGVTLTAAYANDYSTYTTLTGAYSANDGVTLTAAYANDYTTYAITTSNINVVQNNLTLEISNVNSNVYNLTHSPVVFDSDVSIRGNLFLLSQNATIITANSISTDDSLIYLAANNIVSDIVDIGFFAHYYNGSNAHTGLIRSALTKDYYLFEGYNKEEPDNSIDISDNSFALSNIHLKSLIANKVYSSGVELIANDYSTYTTLSANDGVTLTAAYANDYSTYITLSSNDSATLYSAYANDYTTYLIVRGGIEGANTLITNLQSGLVGSNARISGTESNVIALQGGLNSANTNITNLQTGILGSNTAIINLQSGISGTNTTVATKDTVANVYATWNYLNANIISISSYANTTFSTKSNAAELASAIGTGGGGNVTSKTFNITGSFSGPITGTSRYMPINAFTITRAQMLNSSTVGANLVIQLNKNGDLVNTFTLSSGTYVQNFSNLNYAISTSDYLTVDVLSGSGSNFSFTISN